jgi:hypothetical protein
MADAVEVKTDLRETIAAELEVARARTLALLAPLSDDELARQRRVSTRGRAGRRRRVAGGGRGARHGPFVLGTDDEPWAYDNERAAHEVDLPSFWIDTAPVTNRAFLEFVEAAGYEDPRVWSAEGWARRNEAGLEHPGFWRREGE